MYLTEEQYNQIGKEEVKIKMLKPIDIRLEDGFHVRATEAGQYIIMKWDYYLELVDTYGKDVATYDTDKMDEIQRIFQLQGFCKFDVTRVPRNFYEILKRQLKYVSKKREKRILEARINRFLTARLNVICNFAGTLRPSDAKLIDEIESKLSYEELNLFQKLREKVGEFRESLEGIRLDEDEEEKEQ